MLTNRIASKMQDVYGNRRLRPTLRNGNEVMNKLLSLDFTLDPTYDTYEASRDLHRARRQEWHEHIHFHNCGLSINPIVCRMDHTGSIGATEQEVAWRENFRLWMTFV